MKKISLETYLLMQAIVFAGVESGSNWGASASSVKSDVDSILKVNGASVEGDKEEE